MTDWDYSGSDDITACAKRCSADSSCTCFISRADGTSDFPNCRWTSKAVAGWFGTERGYSGYSRNP